MTFLAQSALANDEDFVARVTQAAVTAAKDIQAEAGDVAGHVKRTDYALQVLRSPQVFGPLFAQGVATNPAITGASTDNDIQFTVNSLWNAYAGVVAPVVP
jgi:hypothetical protein